MKIIKTGEDARASLFEGIALVANSVKTSMGPRGRTTLIRRLGAKATITKDGVSIAKEVESDDPAIQAGIEMIQKVAEDVDFISGDGTTTGVVMSSIIADTASMILTDEDNPVKISQEMMEIAVEVTKEIDIVKQTVENTEDLIKVATISANGDHELGNIIGKAVAEVGKTGIVFPEIHKSIETKAVKAAGYEMNRGYVIEQFVTNRKTKQAILDNPVVLLLEEQLKEIDPLVALLEEVVAKDRSILIVAQELSGEALTVLLDNHIQRILKVCVIQTQGFNDTKMQFLDDLAAVTGSKVISKTAGMKLSEIEFDDLGSVKKAIIEKDKTSLALYETEAIETATNLRVAELTNNIGIVTEDFLKTQLRKRIAQLQSKSITIYVGGESEVSREERSARVTDSINATMSALKDGVVKGGGVALFEIQESMKAKKLSDSKELSKAESIMFSGMIAPMVQIIINAGLNPKVIINKLITKEKGLGYNIITNKFEDFEATGILDPAKTIKATIMSSTSIIGTLLTTEGLIVEKQDINFM